jgi:LPS export ABC transporter protein LptC
VILNSRILTFPILIGIFTAVISSGCNNNIGEINDVVEATHKADTEWGKNIRIVYSDSAVVRLVIHAPIMERTIEHGNNKDIFPKGILIEFMNDSKVVYSWLKAESAIREDRTQKIFARGNVIFYNNKNEKMETPELVWDEKDRKVYTDKLVRITQAEKGDTTYGFGFTANQEFTRFEIRKKVQGKINVRDFFRTIE